MKIYLKKVPAKEKYKVICEGCHFLNKKGYCQADFNCKAVREDKIYTKVPKKEYNKHLATKNKP
jgi:hypothetical protein